MCGLSAACGLLTRASFQRCAPEVSRAEKLKGWFVMMKDTKGCYAGNKLWACCQPGKVNVHRLQN